MNAENFSEWHRRQGNEVIRTKSSYWYEASPHVFQAFPYHWIITPSEKEIKDLVRDHGIYSLRYSTPIENRLGKISYHIFQDKPCNLENIKKKARRSVRDGLANCEIKPISLSNLAIKGWELQKDTLIRQGRGNCMRKKIWETLCLSAEGISGFMAWGAFVKNDLAACLLTTIIDNVAYTLYSLSQKKYYPLCINNAIYYYVTHELMGKDEITSIFFTVQSLDAPKSVDEFKFRMGFQPKPVRQRVVFHPLLKPFINAFSHKLINYTLHLFPDNAFLPKTEGMVRFYREGKMPVTKQDVPDCLDLLKDKILKSPLTT